MSSSAASVSQLAPNCSRVLHHLGLEEDLRAAGCLPEATQFRHWRTGRIICESALGSAMLERYGYPYYHIHRADLLERRGDELAVRDGRHVALDLRPHEIATLELEMGG